METLSDQESAEVLSIDMHLWGPCKFGTRAVSGLRSHLRSHTTRAHWVSQEQATIKDLTHLARIVCFSQTFENNFIIKQKFNKFLKEGYCLTSGQHFFLKYFPKNSFVSIIFKKLSCQFWRPECKWINLFPPFSPC